MGLDQTYLDTLRVKNKTSRPISIGDLNISIDPGQTLDLLKRASKEDVNQSQHLQLALRRGWLTIQRTKREKRTANERKASIAWEESITVGVVGPTGPAGPTGPTGPTGPAGEKSESTLDALTDVGFSELADHDFLQYDDVAKEWVNASVSDLEMQNITSVSENYTILGTEDVILVDAGSSDVTVTLPAAASYEGKIYKIKKVDSSNNIVILDGNGSETIDKEDTQELTVQGDSVDLVSDGTEWWVL